jgi:hypothetical protein
VRSGEGFPYQRNPQSILGVTRKEKDMFKRRISTLVVPALLLLVGPAIATASATKRHKVKLSGLIDTLSSKGATGVPRATETDSGILTGTISGKPTRGAFYQSATWGSGLTLTGKGVAFNPKGSIRFKASVKFVPASGGTFSYSGKVTATGGTGIFKGARGTLSTSGTTLTSDPDGATIKMTGTLKY